MNTKIYLVIAYRWGDFESHSYPVGTSLDFEVAKKLANDEHDWRGGKYEAVVYESENITEIDLQREHSYSNVKEVYRSGKTIQFVEVDKGTIL